MESMRFLAIVTTFSLLSQSLAKPVPLEEGVLLRQIADSYSAPLVASFLHSRIQNTAQMIEDIKNSLENLSAGRHNLFTLKVKSLEALDKKLTALQKTNYFNFDGTERVKYLIEQYFLNNEMFPIELGSEETKFNSTPDDLLKQLNIVSNSQLIQNTNDLINVYIQDIEEKESDDKYNELQRLAATFAKQKLKTLINFKYSEPSSERDYYGNPVSTTDNRAPQIESVLRQFKNILDLFYPQFANLASQSAPSFSLKSFSSVNQDPVEVIDETPQTEISKFGYE